MNLLRTPGGRKVLFALLYASEGAPIGFLWWALPTRLRAAGVPLGEITPLLSLLVLPWAFKFLWAPLVDTLRTRRWGLRSWIVATQLLMGATLLPLLALDLREDFALLFPLLLLHAFFAATQDASIDALCVAEVPSSERGSVNGWMQTGMLAARGAFGGGVLYLAENLGDEVIVLALVGAVWFSTILVVFSRERGGGGAREEAVRALAKEFRARIRSALRRRATWFALLFAAVSGAGFEAVGAVAGPFLIDRGYAEEEVGLSYLRFWVPAMVAGALVGGRVSDRIGRRRAVAIFLLALAAVVLALAGTDAAFGEAARAWLPVLLAGLYFAIGLFVASSYALFMDLTDPRLGATQFSAYLGATNGCEAWATATVGALAASLGYPAAFAVMAGISLLSLPLLRGLR